MRYTRVAGAISPEEFDRDIDKPGLMGRIERLPEPVRVVVNAELAHLLRVRNGVRARPDQIPPTLGRAAEPTLANKHGLPTPFAPKDTLRPDLAANPEYMERMNRIGDRAESEILTNKLQDRMGTDADRPLPEPTLRDQIEAAAAVHSKE